MSELSKESQDRLELIRLQNGGALTPEAVLTDARNPASPLHSHFTWSKEEAAARFNLIEAGRLIARVRVTILPDEQRKVTVVTRAYEPVGQDGKGQQVYRRIGEIMNDEEKYQELLATARREIETLERRYRNLVELRPVFEQARRVFLHRDGDNDTAAAAV